MIRPAYRAFYGRAWRKYRARLLEVRGEVCADCGIEPAAYINLSHTTHDPQNSSIKILCCSCHTRRDARHRLAVTRRRRAEACGQFWLMPELEYAATPAWAIPATALAAIYAQGELFA